MRKLGWMIDVRRGGRKILMENELQKIMTDMHDLILAKTSMRKFAKMLGIDRKKIIKGLTGQTKTEMKLDVFLKIVYALYEDHTSRRKRMNLLVLLQSFLSEFKM
ncbi:hypothetical protein [Bacillus sp. 196mf]|uniref:hypothetical protein n=1 Tax=Bacillus sp. 196mf TaxID=1761754 RepID=UPI000D837E55|nr:hypothetical protein [Bacillus sp. 196mf]PYE86954.1 hypothetical protein ATL10_10962 [Bacillus sp. 196mf]